MGQFYRWIIALMALGLMPQILGAKPVAYMLQAERSSVAFNVAFGPDLITGNMPISRADLVLDFQNVARSSVQVEMDVTGAQASFPFAAQALRGPKVLDAKTFPRLIFHSRSVKRDGKDALVSGDITIKGVTKPAVLRATVYRQAGQPEGDLSALTIHLTGALNRMDFGADGWADMVGPMVNLDIMARIKRIE